jgi:hypothetical protein
MTFAPKNARSIMRNVPPTPAASHTFQPHRSLATTYARMVVMTIVVVTAMP